MAGTLAAHQHGKSKVRLGRVWREGKVHHMVEWTVFSMLESDMAHAFIDGSNADMTATDTQKNTVIRNSERNLTPVAYTAICQLILCPELCSTGLLCGKKLFAAVYA